MVEHFDQMLNTFQWTTHFHPSIIPSHMHKGYSSTGAFISSGRFCIVIYYYCHYCTGRYVSKIFAEIVEVCQTFHSGIQLKD